MTLSRLSLNEIRLIAENRKIDGYQNMSKDQLISLINTLKLLRPTQSKRIYEQVIKQVIKLSSYQAVKSRQ